MSAESAEHSPEEIERGRKLFAGECRFLLGVTTIAALPPADLPEIAFAGRSNVGKSSLLNALTGRRSIARTSNTPGRTRELNFFDLAGQLRLVDLPGYGFARAARKDVNQWTKLTRDFLRGRVNLRRVCVLIDARHGIMPPDLEVMDILDKSAVPYQAVLTKADKVKTEELEFVLRDTLARLAKRPAAHPVVRPTSSETRVGLNSLRADLANLAER